MGLILRNFWLDFRTGNIVKYFSKMLFFELGGASKGFNPQLTAMKNTSKGPIAHVICRCVSGFIGLVF